MAIPLPQAIGNYRIIAKLGQGGMARALLAVRQGRAGFRKLFVIKQLRPDLLEETDFVEMFFDEARLAALLNHQNVVQTHEIIEDDGECAISMEYLEGQPLSRIHRRVTREKLSLHLHIYILTEALAGLHYAHNLTDLSGAPLNVVHRDISPGNVFVTYDGQVKLLDFGIAKAAGATSQTKVGGIKGKLQYMAPEQAMAEKLDRRADLFAVGILLWEALAQRTLVPRGEQSAVTLNNRVNGNWPSISEIWPDAPTQLVAACDKAMAMHPQDRFADADQFRRALLAWLEHEDFGSPREQVADLVSSYFGRERALLSQKIAEKIEEDEPFASDEALISRTALTSAGRSPDKTIPKPSDTPGGVTTEDLLASATQRPNQRGKSRGLLVGSVLLALVGGALLFYFSTRGPGSNADTRSATAAVANDKKPAIDKVAAKPTTESRKDEAAKSIELFVSAAPSSAAIELDGFPLDGNPYKGQVARDGEEHELFVSADGHEPATRMVRFDSDIHIELSLSESKGGDSRARSEAAKAKARARAKARRARAKAKKAEAEAAAAAAAEADAKAKAEAAAKAAADAKAKADAEAKAKAKAKRDQNPKAGDVLTRPKDKNSRKIDEENPYE